MANAAFTRSTHAVLGALTMLPQIATVNRDASPRDVEGHLVRHVDRFTAQDGLAENNVRSVLQDRAGFIWTLTRAGVLQRYDGHSFVEYHAMAGASAVPPVPVRLLMRDAEGWLWASTDHAMFRIDSTLGAGSLLTLDHGVKSGASEGSVLWIIDGGTLKRVDTRVPSATTVGERDAWPGAVIAPGREGRIWLARQLGATLVITDLDPRTGNTRTITLATTGMPNGIVQDSGRRVWVTGEFGLVLVAPDTWSVRMVEGFRGRVTTPPAPDDAGGFYVATDDWLARIAPDGGVVERVYSPQAFGRAALPSGVQVDREGGVWLATTTLGLLRLHMTRSAFDHYSSQSAPPVPLGSNFVMALHEQRDETLWVGTLRGGAYRVSPGWTEVTRVPHASPAAPSGSHDVWDFVEDDAGNLWMGTSVGLCRLVATRFHCRAELGAVVDIAKMGDGWFWLSSSTTGVVGFDPRRGQLGDHVEGATKHGPVIALFADSGGRLWMGGQNTLLSTKVSAGRVVGEVVSHDVPLGTNDQVYDFHRDRQGMLLVGTGAGLLQWREDAGGSRFEFTELPDLRRSSIFSISEDDRGNLWLGTALGLVHYVPERGYVRLYGRRDNVLSGEFNRRAALRRLNNDMLFGGIDGITQFDPEVVTGSRSEPPVVFTRFSRLTSEGPVVQSITGRSQLRLEPGDRAFTIEFAALSYAPNPGRVYRYRIDGLNPSWVESTDHVATYPTPSPGRYVLRVETATGGGAEWSSPGASVILDVIPPFWNTAWFKVAMLALAVALTWGLHRWRLRHVLLTERLRLRISRDLHDEIGAGLSSIALLSDATDSRQAAGDERARLRRIGESARGMVADLREIVWAIDPENDQTQNIVARMRDVGASLLRDITVVYEFPSLDAAGQIGMDARRDLLLLYKEMLHNVAKHSQATEVRVSLRVQRRAFTLTVADNGIGFSPNGAHGGTGLRSLRDRAARLGGDLQIESTPGRGTTLTFTQGAT